MATPPEPELSILADGGSVRLTGELTFHTAPQLELAIAELMTTPPGPLTLNLADVAFCDSVGMGTLVRLKIDAVAAGWEVFLAHPRPQLHNLLIIAGLDEFLVVAADTTNDIEPLPEAL
jgi:anti-sigma B factor antagonist